MPKKESNRKDIWLIEWQDAHSRAGWATDRELEEFIKEEKCICEEVGWILSESKDEVVMGARRLKWRTNSLDSEWGLLQKIPKAWIKKRRLLKGK